ncbi:MAG: membrane protein insertase YidC [Desulfobacterales bacterium]|nr:membrane protein insertase YidC [Desulfobacterales bacterium]
MEQKRLLIAIGLSFLVFFGWSVAFSPKRAEQPTEKSQAAKPAENDAKEKTAGASESQSVEKESAKPATAVEEARSDAAAREIFVETPMYRMTLSEKGGAVTSMVLKAYRETIAADSPPKELIPKATHGGTALISFGAANGTALERALFKADAGTDTIDVQGQPSDLSFSYRTAEGVRIEKSYRFFPNTYLVDLNITIHNESGQAIQGPLKIALRHVMKSDVLSYGFQGPSGLINGKLEQVKFKKIEEQNKLEGTMRWVAIEELYFMECLISKNPSPGAMALAYKDNTLENQLVSETGEIPSGGQIELAYSIFMGPKSVSVLKAAGNELDKAIDFGWVEVIAMPCLYFMNFIYHYIPNYGIAIIILTIITRLIFWPLANKSYKSMNDMKKLQPLMQEIREKYKDDKARINQETMALYRTYKINPMGGCLPMLIQLPVFFALYRMLYQAIELRHAPFFGWINDLSAPDRLFNFDFKIPFMTEPYGIPVLTIIMGATMLLQQKLSPQAGDPMQAKMMMLMPIVFTFIFINFPSGLVLYWLVSNVVSISQQYYTMKKTA